MKTTTHYLLKFLLHHTGANKTVDWSVIRRPGINYPFYTGLWLVEFLVIFLGMLLIHILLTVIWKSMVSAEFRYVVYTHHYEHIKVCHLCRNSTERIRKWLHILHNVHQPYIWKDWDRGRGDIQHYKQQWKDVRREMKGMILLHWFENILMMIPLQYLTVNAVRRHKIIQETLVFVFDLEVLARILLM